MLRSPMTQHIWSTNWEKVPGSVSVPWVYEMKIFPVISRSKNCHSHQPFMASKYEGGLQKLHPLGVATPQVDCWGTGGNVRSTMEMGLGPDSSGANERNDFSKPRGVHLPIHRMLNSLTRYLIFDVQNCLLPILQTCI